MIPGLDGYLQPAESRIGPCRHCPGRCPIDDHWDNNEGELAGCEQHPECPGFEEYTAADELKDALLQRAGQ